MHPENPFIDGYNFAELRKVNPNLEQYIIHNQHGKDTIDFSNPKAVKSFNQSLLQQLFRINYWDVPAGFLIPPIPSRLDYILHLKDKIDSNLNVKVLDVGVGANCIFPLLAVNILKAKVVATDIQKDSLKIARAIIHANKLEKKIELRFQENSEQIFKGVLHAKDRFDAVVCNPPFFENEPQAILANKKKWEKLKKEKKLNLNFGGMANELWTEGGAYEFAKKMILESVIYRENLKLCSILISRKHMLQGLISLLEEKKLTYEVIPMKHGNKRTRILLWYLKK